MDLPTTTPSSQRPAEGPAPDGTVDSVRHWRHTTIPPGHSIARTFAAAEGMWVLLVVDGAIRATRRTPTGRCVLPLDRGQVICSPTEAAHDLLENAEDRPAVVADAVLPAGAIGRLLEVLTTPETGHDIAPEPPGRYLIAHFVALVVGDLPPETGRPVPGRTPDPGHDGDDERLPTPPPVGAQAFTRAQGELLVRTMQDRMAERLRVEELAAIVGYSQYHFLRRFQATFGTTPYQYLLDLRVHSARQWLDHDDSPPLEWVANQCGFTRTESLIRAFRQRVGTTPARYAARRRTSGRDAAVAR